MKITYYFTGTEEDLFNLHFVLDKSKKFGFLPTSYFENSRRVEPIKISVKTKKISCSSENLLVLLKEKYIAKYKEN